MTTNTNDAARPATVTIDLPARFTRDYLERQSQDLAAHDVVVIKYTKRYIRLELTAAGYDDLRDDADFYGYCDGLDLDSVGLGLLNSARAVIRRLDAVDRPAPVEPEPEGETIGRVTYWKHAHDFEAFDADNRFLGRFDTKEEAHAAVREAAYPTKEVDMPEPAPIYQNDTPAGTVCYTEPYMQPRGEQSIQVGVASATPGILDIAARVYLDRDGWSPAARWSVRVNHSAWGDMTITRAAKFREAFDLALDIARGLEAEARRRNYELDEEEVA